MTARLELALIVLGCCAGILRAQEREEVFAEFDLRTWRRLGVVVVRAPPIGFGELDALFDDNTGSLVRAAGAQPATFELAFDPPQIVRQVGLSPGGAHPCEVRLSVLTADGADFDAGSHVVEAQGHAVFRMLDVPARLLRIDVERVESDEAVSVSEIRVAGRTTVTAIALERIPDVIPQGGVFPIMIRGLDEHGGFPDLTEVAHLEVAPARALVLSDERHAFTRVGGPVSLAPSLGSLRGERQTTMVMPLEQPLPPPVAVPGMRTVRLTIEGAPPLEVLRRTPGDMQAQRVGIARGQTFDDDVEAGEAYQYAVRRIDRFGNPLSALSAETRVRALSREPDGHRVLGRFPVLIAVFGDSMEQGAPARLAASLQRAREFIWRHTGGQCLLDFTWLDVPGPTPLSSGPTMAGIEARLREMGVGEGEYGAVFAIADDLESSFGGFTLLGRTGGAMGRSADVHAPPGAMGPDPGMAWTFVHEMQHVFDGPFAASAGYLGETSGHFEQDFREGRLGSTRGRPLDVGEAWDGQARLLSLYAVWNELGAPYRRNLETVDSDGDGIPDEDPRFPLDERTLGTRPHEADSDGDGLSDMSELQAGLYRGSDPRKADTDGDGLLDGADPWPLSDFSGRILRGGTPTLLASLADPPTQLLACWTEQTLTLEVVTEVPSDVFVDLDGSGRLGRWETDVNTGTAGAPASDVWCGPARLALRALESPRGVYSGSRPVPGAHVRCEPDGARWRLTAVLPRRLGPGAVDVHIPPGAPRVDGLRLQAGSVLGLSVTIRPSHPNDLAPFEPFAEGGDWASLFETHRLMDAVLVDP